MYLISACLVGQTVRYDAKSYTYPILQQLVDSGQAIIACPEMLGGLACPRAPAEIHGGTALDVLQSRAHILDNTGLDVTQAFLNGAYQTLRLAQKHQAWQFLKRKAHPAGDIGFMMDSLLGNSSRVWVSLRPYSSKKVFRYAQNMILSARGQKLNAPSARCILQSLLGRHLIH